VSSKLDNRSEDIVTRHPVITHALLWAAAILAAAALHAPAFLWSLVLPSLATMALIAGGRPAVPREDRGGRC
jgi:hypothetical protein